MAAWQVSSWRDRNEIVTLITKSLQDITEEEAQTQPFKDAEPPGWHDRLSGTVELCTSRMSFKRQISSYFGTCAKDHNWQEIPVVR